MNNNFLPYQIKKTNEDYNNLSTQLAEKAQQTDLDDRGVSIKEYQNLVVGTDWTQAIKTAVATGKNIFFPIGEYNLNDSVYLNEFQKITLEGNADKNGGTQNCAIIYATADVDLFYMGNASSIVGGRIDCRTKLTQYTHAAIVIDYSTSVHQDILIDTNLFGTYPTSINTSAITFYGTGVEFRSDNPTGTGAGWGTRIKGIITSFKYGVNAKASASSNSWYTSILIDSIFNGCLNAVTMDAGGGGAIHGVIQPFTLNTVKRNIDIPVVKLGTGNIVLDAYIWDIGLSPNIYTIYNTGAYNTVINSLIGYIENQIKDDYPYGNPDSLNLIGGDRYTGYPVGIGSSANRNSIHGNQDNILLGAHQKFTVNYTFDPTLIATSGTPTGTNVLLADASKNAPFLTNDQYCFIGLQSGKTNGTYAIEIILDKPRSIKSVGAVLSSDGRPYSTQIELFSTLSNSYVTVYNQLSSAGLVGQSGLQKPIYKWDYNYTNDSANFGNFTGKNVTKIKFTFTLSTAIVYGSSTGASMNLCRLFAFDGSSYETFLPSYGGNLYGNLNMNGNYITIGNIASLPTASATYRGQIISIQGGSGIADGVFICTQLSDNSYVWKSIGHDANTTSNRPTTNLYIGRRYFDTTLSKPIWLKQVSPAVWVDATGTTV